MKQILKKVLDKIARPITNRVIGFKGRHKGESCYIFGDGASIKYFDLDAFPEKPAFTLSFIPFHKQADALNIRYALLIQPFFFYPYTQKYTLNTWWRNKIGPKYVDFIKKNIKTDNFVNLSNYPVLRGSNIVHLFKSINDPDFGFLQECKAKGIHIFDEGSLTASISLAIYMGFEEIVLVGCDYTHENRRIGHWYEKGKGTLALPNPGYGNPFLEMACKYAKIITITMEGGGSMLPGVPYSEFTGRPLSFRENYEITDMKTLKVLDTWPSHKIF